jgi:hypothetical protein
VTSPQAARARLEAFLDRVPADSLGDPTRAFIRAYLRVVACELGQPDLAERIREQYPSPDTSILIELYGNHEGTGVLSAGAGDKRPVSRAMWELHCLETISRADKKVLSWVGDLVAPTT